MSSNDHSILRANSINSNDNKVHKTSSSISPAASSSLNPRSCVTCRRRKVKCDKKHPCSNCVRQNIDCVFPAPGRAPRKPRKAPMDEELADRLRRLESLVQSLGTQVQPEDESTPPTESTDKESSPTVKEEETHDMKVWRVKKELHKLMEEKWKNEEKQQPPDVNNLSTRFGKLIVHEGRSRYITPGLWSTLKTELEDIKSDRELLDDLEDEEDDYPSPDTSTNSTNQPAFIFNMLSTNVDLSQLHPPPEHIPMYWQLFIENVDALVKTYHVPTREKAVLGFATRLESLDRAQECTMFSIYFAAITSVKPDECKYKFGESKTDLLARYRFGIEQALARADFLKTDSVFVLQAFIVFLICLRPNENPRVVWSLTSLAVRIAQGLGLHRDGEHYANLTPYKREMRRRLWWHAAVLDLRASEDLGSDPSIYELISDTRLPRNLNDSDITFEMTELPESRIGCTDMTFSLIRFEISRVLRHMAFTPPGGKCPKRGNPHFHMTFEKRKERLQALEDRIEEQYLKDVDYSNPLHWLTATSARLILAKLKLMLYVPFQRVDGGASLPQDVRDQLFSAAIQNIEIAVSYQSQGRAQKYSWLLQTYTQWHAIAFLLRELCVRTTGSEVERAWQVVELATSKQSDEFNKLAGHLWKPLRALMDKARLERTKALANEDSVSKPTTTTSSSTEATGSKQPTFSTTDDSMMTMDFGMERLYPSHTENSNITTNDALQDSNGMWQPSNFTVVPSIEPIPMTGSSDLNLMTNLSMNNDSLGLVSPNVDGLGSNSAAGWSPGIAFAANDSAMILDDGAINWATWDDMVQAYAMQNEAHQDGQSTISAFYTTGSNLF